MDQKNFNLGRRSGTDRRKIDTVIGFPERRKGERRIGERRNLGNCSMSHCNYNIHSSNSDLMEIRDEIHKLSQQIKDGK